MREKRQKGTRRPRVILSLTWVIALTLAATALAIAPGPTATASDPAPPAKRTRTVEFFAGASNGGSNANTKYDFPQQALQLAESGVTIKDAYVELAGEYALNLSQDFDEHIYFGMCSTAPDCNATTAEAPGFPLTSTGDATDSIGFSRRRAKVSTTDVLKAYAGGGARANFKVGYCYSDEDDPCEGDTDKWSQNDIAQVSAKLVVTYMYDTKSDTTTNTVLYPLKSTDAKDTGSRTARLGNGMDGGTCAMGKCPTLAYKTSVPEIKDQLSQWFALSASIDAVNPADCPNYHNHGGGGNNTNRSNVDYVLANTNIDVRVNQGRTSTGWVYPVGCEDNTSAWVDYMYSGVNGYANNADQKLEVALGGTGKGQVTSMLGGENYVTYTAAANAPEKTRTVAFPVGEVMKDNAATAKAIAPPTAVNFAEGGVSIKDAWFRIHASPPSVKGTNNSTLSVTTKTGNNPESAAVVYHPVASQHGDSVESEDGYFVHVIPSSDYAELARASLTSSTPVHLSTQWGPENPGGAVSAEMMITYSYKDESKGYLSTQRLFAGGTRASISTSWSTLSGAIDPVIPEASDHVKILGGSLLMNARLNKPTRGGEMIGSRLTTLSDSCSATASSTTYASRSLVRAMMWNNVTAPIVSDDLKTYTACYNAKSSGTFSGSLAVTYAYSKDVIKTHAALAPTPDATPQETITLTTKKESSRKIPLYLIPLGILIAISLVYQRIGRNDPKLVDRDDWHEEFPER